MIKETTIEYDLYLMLKENISKDEAAYAGIDSTVFDTAVKTLRANGAVISYGSNGTWRLEEEPVSFRRRLLYAQMFNKLACDTPREWWSADELADIFDTGTDEIKRKARYIRINICGVDWKYIDGELHLRLMDLDDNEKKFPTKPIAKWQKNPIFDENGRSIHSQSN